MRRLTILCGTLLSLAPAVRAQADERPPPPNVLLIVADDLDERFGLDVRRPGSGAYAFPSLRAIGERGAVFSQSFVALPLCSPSRASILTGRHAHSHGVLGNADDTGGYSNFEDAETLAVWLQRAGYRTAMVGKYLNGYDAELARDGRIPVPPGWDSWFASLSPASYRNWSACRDGNLVRFGADEADYQTDVLAREALAAIAPRDDDARPFFVAVNFFAPHDDAPGIAKPASPAKRHLGAFAKFEPEFPPSFDEADLSDKPADVRKFPPLGAETRAMLVERIRARLESMLAVDEAVAAMLAALEKGGARERTVVIFTSDNGFEQGEHRIRTGKGRAYEESIRVPLAACGPGIPRGARVDALVLNLDLAPTIAELCGAQPRLEVEGRSWMPLLREPSAPWRTDFLIEGTRDHRFTALRSRDALYVEHDADGDGRFDELELYDLRADPFELTSLHADPKWTERMSQMRERLAKLRDCRGAACW